MSFLVALVCDVVHAGVGDFSDVVLGDNGEVDFDTVLIPGTALEPTRFRFSPRSPQPQ